jgi:hypothetical protein
MNDTVNLSLAGKVHEATEPDTLNLPDRARLAIIGMGGNIDPERMTMYGLIFFAKKRPYLSHWASAETLCDPKFTESFPLMRIMSGSNQYAALERSFRDAVLSRVDEGLYWDRADSRRPWRNQSYPSKVYGEGKNEDFCTVVGAGRLLRTLLVYRELDGGSDRDKVLDDLCAGLRRILVVKGDYGYYPEKGGWGEPCAYPRSGWLNTDESQSDTEGGEGSVICMHGHQLYGAAHWHEQSGSPVALDLAAKLANYCMLPRFWGGAPDPDGKRDHLPGHVAASKPESAFTSGNEQGHWYSHFHARAIALRGLLAYGRVISDPRILEFVRRSYEFTLSQGIPRMGWINCFPGANNQMESCALGDLVALGIRLSDAGMGDYWDDVDAVVRNQLMEQQLTDAAALERVAAQFQDKPDSTEAETMPGKLCFDDVISRSLGCFVGMALPTSIPNPWVMQCCTGNATQGLYYAWEGALREVGDRATVNLLLNRAGRLVDVDSFLPYQGRVLIRNHAASRVSIRVPGWAPRRAVRLMVNNIDRTPDWVGQYLLVADLNPGDIIELGFPVKETTSRYTVNARSKDETVYTCTFRGSTLVDIGPRDLAPTGIPIYQRDSLRGADVAPLVKLHRFVPDRVVRGW